MPVDDAIPVQRFEVVAADPQEVVEITLNACAGARVRIFGDAGTFFYRQHTTVAGPMGMSAIASQIGVHLDCPFLDHLVFLTADRGQAGFRTGTGQATLGPGDTLAYPVAEPFTATAGDFDGRVLTLELPVGPVATRAGLDPERFRFASMNPVTPALGRHFRATMRYLHTALLARESALANPLVLTGAIDAAAAAALAAFPHTPHHHGRQWIRSGAVRRAVEFIDANPARPLTLADIAEAAGTSVRALQAGFSRHLDTTPMLYLRRVRLAHAHRDLQCADPDTGVAQVARRWGFGHLGRFAAYYRTAYGQSPRLTMRR
ncbi:AraC family transcriptional regulator [Krasilnikovia sp. MM14-A1259]|uniref:AraC family transcriptional regulator n=1 Tax=Krasilnikovia sp. MM14-A1259 TaxID=3373539 RepID=UPI00399D1511